MSRKPYISKNRLHFEAELIDEASILRLLKPLYQSIGANANDLVRVTPSYGGWLVALRFCIHRADGATTWVTRGDLDSHDRCRLRAALRAFNTEEKPGCSPDISYVRSIKGVG